jgi:3-methyladenine DNA glycosylase AlkC
MAELLKNIFFKRSFFEKLANEILKIYPAFDKKKFFKRLFNSQWEGKELKQRMRHASIVLHEVLPADYRKALDILIEASSGFRGFDSMVFSDFVEVFGLEDPEASIPALEHFTQLCSAEFAVRPFIIRYPDLMIRKISRWSKHKNPHIRRLASEGSRPRLPWAIALPEFKKDPLPILPVIEKLIGDKEEFVRRSAANNLNDIAKDNPQVVLKFAKRWLGKNAETDRVLKHACRTLLKKGDPAAMELFGYKNNHDISIGNFKLTPRVVSIGKKLGFSFTVVHKSNKPLKVRLEYGIYYLKSKGKYTRKVFKIAEDVFKDKTIAFRRNRSFTDMTIRKHRPGKHKISIIVNGIELAEKEFMLNKSKS